MQTRASKLKKSKNKPPLKNTTADISQKMTQASIKDDTEKLTRWVPQKLQKGFQTATGFDIYQIIKYLLIFSVVAIIVLSILSHTNTGCTPMDKCTIDCGHISKVDDLKANPEQQEINKKIMESRRRCFYYDYKHFILNIIRTLVNVFLILFFSYYINKYKDFLFFKKDTKIVQKDIVKSLMIWIFIIKIFLDFSYILIPILIQVYDIFIRPFITT